MHILILSYPPEPPRRTMPSTACSPDTPTHTTATGVAYWGYAKSSSIRPIISNLSNAAQHKEKKDVEKLHLQKNIITFA